MPRLLARKISTASSANSSADSSCVLEEGPLPLPLPLPSSCGKRVSSHLTSAALAPVCGFKMRLNMYHTRSRSQSKPQHSKSFSPPEKPILTSSSSTSPPSALFFLGSIDRLSTVFSWCSTMWSRRVSCSGAMVAIAEMACCWISVSELRRPTDRASSASTSALDFSTAFREQFEGAAGAAGAGAGAGLSAHPIAAPLHMALMQRMLWMQMPASLVPCRMSFMMLNSPLLKNLAAPAFS